MDDNTAVAAPSVRTDPTTQVSETQFSPGTWSIEPHPERPDLPIRVIDGEGDRVAQCSGISLCTTPEQCRANAYLIAAAPDLYRALEAVVSVADRKTTEFDLARSALAKARGVRS